MRRVVGWAWALFMVAALAPPAGAAEERPPGVPAVRVETPPVLDGALDDACWQQASHVTGFARAQKEGPEFERTEAWICYDRRAVYAAFYCHDSQPDAIRASQRKRGGDIERDDRVRIAVDVGHDHRQSYLFELTPRGTQVEEIPGGAADKYEWRGDWHGAARVVADGWVAEFAIPLSMLRYPNGQTSFGVCFSRYLARRTDWSRWPDLGVGHEGDPTKAADWTGLSLPLRRPPLILMPYAVAEFGGSDGNSAADGLDARYTLPNGLVAMASGKPDFRNLEDVVESIDFTYTEKEFPEYRPFFTEGGGRRSEWGENEGSYYPPTMIFYTRRIPYVDFGAKTFGKIGSQSLGLLDAMEPDRVNDLVLGYGYDLGERGALRLGAVRHQDPLGLDNLALHLGTSWAWPQADGSLSWSADLFQGRTEGPGGDDSALSLSAGTWKENGVGWWGWYQQVGEDFQNVERSDASGTWREPVGVGYVPETGLRGGGLWLNGNWQEDTGPRESQGWEAGASAFDAPDGPRWEFSGSRSVSWRDNTSWHLSVGTGARAGFSEQTLDVGHDWNNKDLYRHGSAGATIGTRLGGLYTFAHASQGYRPTPDLSWQWRLEHVNLRAENPGDRLAGVQGLLTATYDVSDDRSISARFVYRRGNNNFWLPQVYYDSDNLPGGLAEASWDEQVAEINVYAVYRQRVAGGRDVLIILGSPNTPGTEIRVALKTVWTHFLGGL